MKPLMTRWKESPSKKSTPDSTAKLVTWRGATSGMSRITIGPLFVFMWARTVEPGLKLAVVGFGSRVRQSGRDLSIPALAICSSMVGIGPTTVTLLASPGRVQLWCVSRGPSPSEPSHPRGSRPQRRFRMKPACMIVAASLALLVSSMASAQTQPQQGFGVSFGIGGGLTHPINDALDILKDGFNGQGYVRLEFGPVLAVRAEVNYQNFDLADPIPLDGVTRSATETMVC